MSTDIVLVSRKVAESFRVLLHEKLEIWAAEATAMIHPQAEVKVLQLLEDAHTRGATLKSAQHAVGGLLRPTIIDGINTSMLSWQTESFGPVVGMCEFDDEADLAGLVNESSFGLSAAVFSHDTFRAFELGKKLSVGTVHINAPTVHDEASLPHGGVKDSGWGRFGSHWAFDEFLQTKTLVMHPS
jgi:acyl-CoA reductase-like NAD-dependent aldehyde dehydrogenase